MKKTVPFKTLGLPKEPLGLREKGLLSLVLIFVTLLCWALYRGESGRVEQRLRERESVRVRLLAHSFRMGLSPTANDLRTLVDSDALLTYLNSGDAGDLDRAIRRAAFFGLQHSAYERIGFLDNRGQEILRISQGGGVASAEVLRTHFDRGYFQRTRTLTAGQIHVSAVDLALENGAVAEPPKAIMQFATPVFDRAGERRGIYHIDYHVSDLITRLKEPAPLSANRLWLVNTQGYWISGPEPGKEWGFRLPGRGGFSIAQSDPALWARLVREREGQIRHGGGLLTWERITPHEFVGGDPRNVTTDEDFLIIASEVAAPEFAGLTVGLKRIFLFITPTLLVLAASSGWFFSARRQAQEALRRSEESLGVTLQSIGDAVMATDTAGKVTRMNRVAEQLTGWTFAAAHGRPLGEILRLFDEDSRQPGHLPVADVLATGEIRGLAKNTVLITPDGTERNIADSAAPIRDRRGRILGVVLVFRDVSTERQAERNMAAVLVELSRERGRLKFIFDSVPIGISLVLTQADGTRTRLINEAHLRICDLTREQADRRGAFARITHPADREKQDRLNQQLNAGEIDRYSFDKRYVREDGRIVWVILSCRRQTLPDGSREDLFVLMDIDERKQAEEALRKSSEEIRDLYNLAPCGYHSLDANGFFAAINETELKWLGYAREEVIGRRHFSDVLTDESRTIFRENFERFKREGSVSDLEFRIRRKDGTVFPVVLNSIAIRDATGSYVSSRSTLFNIEDRQRAEHERDRFFNLSIDLLCISSVDGYFKRISPAVTDILGWSVEEFLAQPYIDLVHPEDQAATLAEVKRQVSTGEKVLHFENRYRHKDGTWRVLSWCSVPQPDGLMYASARDVTEVKRTATRIERLNDELQLRASELEIANKELESFSYSVSHDLRAPLRHVQGYVEMLTREVQTQLSDKARRYLKTIAAAGREMGELIDDLLSFSRMGRAEMRETNVDFAQLVQEVRQSLELSIQDRQVVWKLGALPNVKGDPAMLKQVLANLLDNSVKYTRPRHPAVIEISCVGEEDGRLVFCVRDNGVGFEMKYGDKLFGVFQRLHRADEFEGTGIGLASVRRIITRHGGRTWAEGKQGVGAALYFTLAPVSP